MNTTYKKIALLLGAEVYNFTDANITVPTTEGNVNIEVSATRDNFKELVLSELSFSQEEGYYSFEVLFSAIVRLQR